MTDKMDATQAMRIIKALDPDASLLYSEYNSRWYVSARIAIGDGITLSSISEHQLTPDLAVLAYMASIRQIDLASDKFLVTKYQGHRREWRWNGAAFAECTSETAPNQ